MAQTRFYKPIRAIKIPFKLFVEGFLVIFGLFLIIPHISATTIFSDSFEDCTIGILNGQCDWVGNSTTSAKATSTEHFDELQSAYWDSSNIDYEGITSYRVGNSLATGTILFWFKIKEAGGGESVWLELSQSSTPDTSSAMLSFTAGKIRYYNFGSGYVDFCTSLSADTWYNTQIQWRASDDKVNYYCGKTDTWTGWIENSGHNFDTLGVITFRGPDSQTGLVKLYVDWFAEKNPCWFYQTWAGCENANCCWYYSPFLKEYFCVDCPVGECASSILECQNCSTQENCEAQEFCYWFNSVCKYGTGACGEGLELQFCENQSECEGFGGYWYGDYCWLEPKPSLLSFDEYYNEFGDYATPSAWIVSVASSSTGFFESIGGFLATFENFFDLREAYQKGIDFGSAIPTARGYLKIFDDFLGPLPISGFFIFILGFMLAVGVFRIVRNLIQLLKFW